MSLKIRILFDEIHNEGGKLNSTYNILRHILENNQMEAIPLFDFPITLSKIEKYDIFVIAGPDMSKFRITEIDDIISYVKDGGKLIVMADAGGDSGHMTNLNKLVSYFGVQFNSDQVIDSKSNLGIETVPIIEKISKHEITEGVPSIAYRTGCSLSVKGDLDVLIKSNDTSNPPNIALLTLSKFGNGLVVCIGTYEIFRDSGLGGIKTENHERLILNIFDYLLTSGLKAEGVISVEEIETEGIPPFTEDLKLIESAKVKPEKTKISKPKMLEKAEATPIIKPSLSKEVVSNLENLNQNVSETLKTLKEHLYSNSELQEKLILVRDEINEFLKKLGETGFAAIPDTVKQNKKAIDNLIPIINKNLEEIKSIKPSLEIIMKEIKKSSDLTSKRVSKDISEMKEEQIKIPSLVQQEIEPLKNIEQKFIGPLNSLKKEISQNLSSISKNFDDKIVSNINNIELTLTTKLDQELTKSEKKTHKILESIEEKIMSNREEITNTYNKLDEKINLKIDEIQIKINELSDLIKIDKSKTKPKPKRTKASRKRISKSS